MVPESPVEFLQLRKREASRANNGVFECYIGFFFLAENDQSWMYSSGKSKNVLNYL
jgi:hypothetical protein